MLKVYSTFLRSLFILFLVESAASRLLNKENITDSKVEKYETYRLPKNTYPEHYNIKLTTNVHTGERSFQGEVAIDIVVVTDTYSIVLHAHQLDIAKVHIRNSNGDKEPEELSKAYDSTRNFLILTSKTQQKFIGGGKYLLTIYYRGELNVGTAGFFITKYSDEKDNDRYLAATQFESTNARLAFPCYDEPALRAKFTITLHHSPTYTAISNMPVNEILSSPNKTVFLTTDRISTYMVTFVLSDLKFTEGILGGKINRVYSRPSALGEHDWALMAGMFMVKHLSQYLGIDYMLPKIDYVALPELASNGVENFGLISTREKNLLYNKTTSNAVTQSNILLVLAHEISHQWFGGYVTIEWWNYLWLKEGFATLLSYKVLENYLPEWSIWQGFYTFEYQNALEINARNDARPMTDYVETPTDIARVYGSVGSVPYAKAASVLRMWNGALTEKVFQKALNIFLIDNQYKAATEDELLFAFESAIEELYYQLPASIYDMMLSWTQQGGYPLLTVTRNYTDGSFTIKQEAFHSNGFIDNEKIWYVPINYAVASNPDHRNTEASHYMLYVAEMTISENISENDWLLLNKQSIGFYRINYDAKNWQLITDGLIDRASKFHVLNRAQFMTDAYLFSETNRLDHDTVLNLLTYLRQEDQYAPWSTANTILHRYDHFLAAHHNYDKFKKFLVHLVRPIFRKLGADEVPGEHHYNNRIRQIVLDLACSAGLKECLKDTTYKLLNHINAHVPIEQDLQNNIYCNGLRQASDEVFDSVYQKLINSTDQQLRRNLIGALGCSQNERQIKKYLDSILDASNKLSSQERLQFLYPAYSHGEVGLMACIEFLNNNWLAYGYLSAATGIDNFLDIEMRDISAYILNNNEKKIYLALLSKVKEHERVSATLESDVLSKISNNFEWVKVHGKPIMRWVTKYVANIQKGHKTGSSP